MALSPFLNGSVHCKHAMARGSLCGPIRPPARSSDFLTPREGRHQRSPRLTGRPEATGCRGDAGRHERRSSRPWPVSRQPLFPSEKQALLQPRLRSPQPSLFLLPAFPRGTEGGRQRAPHCSSLRTRAPASQLKATGLTEDAKGRARTGLSDPGPGCPGPTQRR